MTLKEFNIFLKEGTTYEMFKALVLYHIQDNYMITGCNTNSQGDKIYTIQDSWVGNEYYLILDFSNKIKDADYPQEKYMIAKKELKTISMNRWNFSSEREMSTTKVATEENEVTKWPMMTEKIIWFIKKKKCQEQNGGKKREEKKGQ